MLPQGLVILAAIQRELRRVQHDRVELPLIRQELPQVRERIGVDKLDAGLVEVGVLAGQRDGRLIQVDARHLSCLAELLGTQGEAAGVAAQVEHRSSASQSCET